MNITMKNKKWALYNKKICLQYSTRYVGVPLFNAAFTLVLILIVQHNPTGNRCFIRYSKVEVMIWGPF